MRRIYIISALAAVICLAGCKQNKAIQGTVVDATMNTICLATEAGDTVTVSTMDTDPDMVPGVLIGDVVKVSCETVHAENGDLSKAVKLDLVKPSNYRLISGYWTTTNGENGDKYGFTLAEDGTAESINMFTLRMKNWVLDGDELALTAESEGSGAPFTSTTVYKIAKLDVDSLVLEDKGTGYAVWSLGRDK